MDREKLKIVIGFAAALCLLLAPIFLVVNSNGVAHAKKPPGQIGKPGPPPGHRGPPPHASSPEPATWLLIGSGAAGLVLLRKKLKK